MRLYPQYRGLENLWQYYRERGLVVLGFLQPVWFSGAGQPAGDRQLCSLNYGVSFPLFSKIDVNGPGAHPLFNELKRLAPGILGSRRIKWNFTKFLLTADGQRVTRFAPITKPERLFDRIETLLK